MSTLYCSNFPCQAKNELENTVCQSCGTPLVKRYLWAVGDWIKAYKLGELVEERYLLVHPRIFLDTKPAEKPQSPEDIPDRIKLYLRLFPARLHVPQVYGYLPSPDPEMDLDIWLLEYGSLPLGEKGEPSYPELLPTLTELWPQASALQQLIWLWQIARLWQPLEASGVVSSLLDPFLLRIHGFNVQLLELKLDEHTYHGVKDLEDIWTALFKNCQPIIADFVQELLARLNQGKIPHAEYLSALLEKAIAGIASHYEFDYQVVTATDKGPTRDHNEDYCYPLSTIRISYPEPDLPETSTEESVALEEATELEKSALSETPTEESVALEESEPVENEALSSEKAEPITLIPELSEVPDHPSENLHEISEMVDLSQVAAAFTEESSMPEEGDVPTTPSPESTARKLSGSLEKSTSTLAIICDGVGGQDGGEIASQGTVTSLVKVLNSRLTAEQRSEAQQALPQLHRCISEVNDRINFRNDQEKRSERARMGTTLVMLMSEKHQAYLGNVGDSRCYWITEDSCQQVTVDDDLASREVRLGYIFYREAIQIPRSGALVQAMGLAPSTNLHPALARLFIGGNSLFLLCSDGLCDFDRVEQYWPFELLPVLRGEIDLGTGCDRLISLANAKNGHDNVTVALVSVEVTPPTTELPKLDYEEIASQLPEMLPPPVAPVIMTPQTNTKGSLLTSDFGDMASNLSEVFNKPIDFRTGNTNFWIGIGFGVVIWGAMVYLMGRLLTPAPPPEIVPEVTPPAPPTSSVPPASPLPSTPPSP